MRNGRGWQNTMGKIKDKRNILKGRPIMSDLLLKGGATGHEEGGTNARLDGSHCPTQESSKLARRMRIITGKGDGLGKYARLKS